ncbi:MAG: hypothetical protein KF886_19580 [Candidatus Hydrogenedentes bacterium]|nr:hypothetical protein [Candidatus Hydrogenedentota bacterium]
MRAIGLPALILLAIVVHPPPAMAEAAGWREAYFSGAPLRIGNKPQFLVDDFLVEDRYALDRVVGPVEKYAGNPLRIGETMPWEEASLNFSGANLRHVVYDPEEAVFKGWYVTYRIEPDRNGSGTNYNYDTLYAESRDGITWEKPALDLFPFDGRPTNTVLHADRETALLEEVILDPAAADPSRRYTALVKTVPPGESIRCIVRMHSPDGKRWTLDEDPVLFRGASDGSYSLVRDGARDRWLLFRRPPARALENRDDPFYGHRNNKRRFSVSSSEDGHTWTYPRAIPILDEVDDARLEQVGNRMDIDWATAFARHGMFFGFLSLMDNLKIAAPVHNQLMWSRDGFRWERLPARPAFIPNGPRGDWDAQSIHAGSIIPHGDRFHLYYSGSNTTQSFHGREGETNIPRFTGTGLAFIGRDRFAGLAAGPEGGYLLTRQILLEGDRLHVNIRPHEGNPPPGQESRIIAEILRPAEEHYGASPYPGFGFHDCDVEPLGDFYEHAITWNGSGDLSTLQGKPVYIRFNIKNATLYTFTIVNTPGA